MMIEKLPIMTRIGLWLMRQARYFLGRDLKRCWICGCAPGMGLITKQGIWCPECERRWHKFDRPEEGFVVDWRGLGRRVEVSP